MTTLMLDIQGETLSAEDTDLLSRGGIGGVILFGRNTRCPNKTRALTSAIRTINPTLVIGIDQEGGRVRRLKTGVTPIGAMGRLGKHYQVDPVGACALAYAQALVMAYEMRALGIDASFAPVLDLDGISQVIGDRAFSSTVEAIIALGGAWIDGMTAAGMCATAKHFPGHGQVLADTHHVLAVDWRDKETIFADMAPFACLVPKLGGIMPAHVIYPAICSKGAGFSHIWLQEVLRGCLGFDGAIFSDDLSMQGASTARTLEDNLALCQDAGVDVALVCNDRPAAKIAQTILKDTTPAPCLLQYLTEPLPWRGDVYSTCGNLPGYVKARALVLEQAAVDIGCDPTKYRDFVG